MFLKRLLFVAATLFASASQVNGQQQYCPLWDYGTDGWNNMHYYMCQDYPGCSEYHYLGVDESTYVSDSCNDCQYFITPTIVPRYCGQPKRPSPGLADYVPWGRGRNAPGKARRGAPPAEKQRATFWVREDRGRKVDQLLKEYIVTATLKGESSPRWFRVLHIRFGEVQKGFPDELYFGQEVRPPTESDRLRFPPGRYNSADDKTEYLPSFVRFLEGNNKGRGKDLDGKRIAVQLVDPNANQSTCPCHCRSRRCKTPCRSMCRRRSCHSGRWLFHRRRG